MRPRKKNGFWTFVFACLPGAGHMYMGFMKIGLSLMGAFFLLIFLSSWLNIGPILFLMPVLWFYSFFDCLNKRYSSDEEFSAYQDDYLFTSEKMRALNRRLHNKGGLILGIVFLLLGCYLLWKNMIGLFSDIFPGRIYNFIGNVTGAFPQVIVGVAIVALGLWLIIGKKKETNRND